ncbi:MAG: hypothetical protein M0Z52_07385 [Actinomycetota bacterium]|nr:hypothetical protein [Actinomycetota bacterium]
MAVVGFVATENGKRGVQTGANYGFLAVKKMPSHYNDGDPITVSEDMLNVDGDTLELIHKDLALADGRITQSAYDAWKKEKAAAKAAAAKIEPGI